MGATDFGAPDFGATDFGMGQAFVFSCASFYIWSGKLNVKTISKSKRITLAKMAAATQKGI